MAQLAKRDNWAQREPGVIVVLVIVFLVLCLLIGLFISKRVRHPASQCPYIRLTSTSRKLPTAHKIPPMLGEEVDRKSRERVKTKAWLDTKRGLARAIHLYNVCTKSGSVNEAFFDHAKDRSRRSRGNEFRYLQ